MQATTTAYDTMADSPDQITDAAVNLTLPGNVYPDVTVTVTDLSISAAIVSDMPDGTRLQVGYPQMTATFTLKGFLNPADPTTSVAWLFGPYQETSPLYRTDALQSPVTIEVGLIPSGANGVSETLRKFTGVIDDYTINLDGTVNFSCVDNRALLRGIAAIPAVVTAPPFNSGLTSEYAIDALLREASNGTISSWPVQRPKCILAAGFRSSLWPEVGTLYTVDATPQPLPSFGTGVFGSALIDTDSTTLNSLQSVVYTMTQSVGRSLFVEFWVSNVFFPVGVGIHDASSLAFGVPVFTIQATTTGVEVDVSGALGGPNYKYTKTINTGPHYIAVLLTLPATGGTAWSAKAWVDGTSNTSAALAFANGFMSDLNLVSVTPQSGTLEALQITTETAPVTSYPFTPQAVLDRSLNALSVVPAISGDPWQTIQQIADAELGVAGFDEYGIFRFRNRKNVATVDTARTVTSHDSLKDLQIETTAAGIVNHATVDATPWNVSPTPPGTIYAINSLVKVPRRTTITINVTTDTLVVQPDTSVTYLPQGYAGTAASYYRASIDTDGVSDFKNNTGWDLGFVVTQPGGADKLRIKITNPSSSYDAYLVSAAFYTDMTPGTPFLHIAGRTVTPADTFTADFQWPPVQDDGTGGAITSRFGEVAYQSTGNLWIQDPDSAQALAQDIVLAQHATRPNLTNVSIVPDFRLQLTDLLLFQDTDITQLNEYAFLFGWTLTWDGGQAMSMTVDARTLAPPGAFILGLPGRSEIGSTAYLY